MNKVNGIDKGPVTTFVVPGAITGWASSRLRGLWPAQNMTVGPTNVVQVNDDIPQSDVYVWVKQIDTQVIQRPGFHFWDVCDPMWWFSPVESREAFGYTGGWVCSNGGLARDFAEFFGVAPHVILDRLDLNHFRVKAKLERPEGEPIKIVWFGAAQNRVALYAAFPSLYRLHANGIKFELSIYDDRPDLSMGVETTFPTKYYRWSYEGENEFLASHDLALLPPYPGDWGLVKSTNKKVTAWACGLPVSDGSWDSLYKFAASEPNRKEEVNVRTKVLYLYDAARSGQEWDTMIRKVTK